MSLLKASELDVLEAHVSMPRVGCWVADMVLDSETALADGDAVTLAADGGLELKGTVMPGRSSTFVGAVTARIVAGKGGMSKPAAPRYYAGAQFGDVINGLLKDSGETLSSTSDQALLSRVLDSWMVLRQPVSRALTVLLERVSPATSWRMLPDGTLWIGAETWPAVDPAYEYEVISQHGADASAEIAAATPVIVPGVTLPEIGRVSHVEHWVTSDKVRSVVTCETGSPRDRIKGALLSLARGATPGIDHYALYRAKVVKQTGQKFDVKPDDTRLATITDVPLRNGIPGLTVEVATGSYVLLGWENGDPQRRYVALWEGGETVTKAVINGTTVHLGSETGSQFVALANKVNDELAAIQATLESLSVVGSATGEFTVPYTAGTVDAANVKAK